MKKDNDTMEVALEAALAQNAQGEASFWITPADLIRANSEGDNVVACPAIGNAPADAVLLYLHAEHARVPELMMERLADAAAALDKLGRRDQCRHLMWLHEHLAAAPSQPQEVAIRFPLGTWSLDGHWAPNPMVELTTQEQREHNKRYGYPMQSEDVGHE